MAIDKIQSESINLADNFAFTGTVTGAGGVNTPIFKAQINSTQSLSNNTTTLVAFNNVITDTASAYTNSAGNYKFTVPSGQAGKYHVYARLLHRDTDNNMYQTNTYIYKNGVEFAYGTFNTNSSSRVFRERAGEVEEIITLSEGDYIQIYAYQVNGSGNQLESTTKSGHTFNIFKLIE